MPAKLSTHVLDTAHGCPAEGLQIELWSLEGETRRLLKTFRTNADGRADQPLLASEEMQAGRYELVFYVGDYFTGKGFAEPAVRFLDRVPVQFGIADPVASYHIPLLVSPWAYSTYRGS
jgi:5-hydroxyisourate hydrolase